MIQMFHAAPADIAVEVDGFDAPGAGIVGTVLSVGAEVMDADVQVGDRVLITFGRSMSCWVREHGSGSQVMTAEPKGRDFGGGQGRVVLVRQKGPATIIGRVNR